MLNRLVFIWVRCADVTDCFTKGAHALLVLRLELRYILFTTTPHPHPPLMMYRLGT